MSRKEKFALYLPPELRAEVEEHYQEDGSHSLTAFIENAVRFYLGYLDKSLFLTSIQIRRSWTSARRARSALIAATMHS